VFKYVSNNLNIGEQCNLTDEQVKIDYFTEKGRQTHILTTKIRKLDLSCRNITSIDFTPFHKDLRIKYLNLSGNNIEKIHLEPLCALKYLRVLNLQNNPLKFVDVTPLLFCDSLVDFHLNKGIHCLVTPMASFTRANLPYIHHWDSLGLAKDYDSVIEEFGWRSTLKSIRTIFNGLLPHYWFTAQRGLLFGMGMAEVAAYDGDPGKLLRGVKSTFSFEESRDKIYDNAITLLEKQLDKGGSTHFLDVDDLAITRAVLLVPKIIAARRREMETLTIEVVEEKTDARTIWFTFYGQMVMQELGYTPFSGNKVRLRDIVAELERAEFRPNVVTKKKASKKQKWQKVSEGLAAHLELIGAGYNLVQYGITSKPWFLKRNSFGIQTSQ